jgi:hypothetical protein
VQDREDDIILALGHIRTNESQLLFGNKLVSMTLTATLTETENYSLVSPSAQAASLIALNQHHTG